MPASLGRRSLEAILWGGGGAFLRLLMQTGAQITLARLLGPEQYGIFAIGAIVIGFSNFFSDVGLAYGLIQKDRVDNTDIQFVLTWQVLLGTLVTCILFWFSVEIAVFFGDVRAQPVVASLSLLCLINGLAAPSLNLMKRELRYKVINVAQLISYLVAYIGVALPMAWFGMDIWALVVAWLLQSTLNAAILYGAYRYPLKLVIWYDDAGKQLKYGATVLLTNLVNWATGSIDKAVVARRFGAHDVGLYSTTFNLLYNPTAAVVGVVQPVFFSASSRIGGELDKQRFAYLMLLGLLGAVMLPAFVSVALIAQTFVLAIYGPAWIDAAGLVTPIALGMPVFMVMSVSTPLLWTAGSALTEFKIQLPMAMAWAVVCLMAATLSVKAVAWAMLGMYCLRCLTMMSIAGKAVVMPLSQITAPILSGIRLTMVVGSAVLIADAVCQSLLAIVRLGIDLGVAAGVWCACAKWLPAMISLEAREAFSKIRDKVPNKFKGSIEFLCVSEARV